MKTYIYSILLFILSFSPLVAWAQEEAFNEEKYSENVAAKGQVVNETTIKLRWTPTSSRAWLHGRNYGYVIERYTVMLNNKWQDDAKKIVLNPSLKVTPLAQWEEYALKSDYAAVIAQAFYGEDFELNTTANDVGSIINRSSELDQRFATSAFMAEYDYKAAELAGWAYTDNTIKKDEKYVYRIIIDRPIKQVGDTAAVFIGFADKEELLKPMELNARWGDKSVMLTWNYELRSREYHSYHVERKSVEDGNQFRRISELPITVLNADMKEAFYIDTLKNNEIEYSYRIIGLTSFGEEGPASDIVVGKGEKKVECIPQIYAGEFISDTSAEIFWEFECEEIDLVDKLQLTRADKIEGEYSILIESIDKKNKSLKFDVDNSSYLKLSAINKDSSKVTSYSFQLQKIDSIPPAIPTGLAVKIDTAGVAHMTWDTNTEEDLRGYRILRSFSKGNEKSVLTSDFIKNNFYTDTLSLNLLNEKVYYSLTALDMRYNESEPCAEVVALKPNNSTPFMPRFLDHRVEVGEVSLEWVVDSLDTNLTYKLERIATDTLLSEVLYIGDYKISKFTDSPEVSGAYDYSVSITNAYGKQSKMLVPLHLFVKVDRENNKVSRLNAYLNEKEGYVELSWKKHPNAVIYRIYKSEDDQAMTLWKEFDSNTNRVVDEHLSPNTKYTYTILFTTQADGPSKMSTVSVNY